MARAGTLLALALALVACGPQLPPPPRWIALADELSPTAHAVGERRALDARLTLVQAEGGAWLEAQLARSEWRFRPRLRGGIWQAPLGLIGSGRPDGLRPAQELVAGERVFRHDPPDELHERWSLRAGGFHAAPEGLTLKLAPGEEPPESARLRVWTARGGAGGASAGGARSASSGRAHDSPEAERSTAPSTPPSAPARDGAPARVRGPQRAGAGFALWPGERVELVLDLPADSSLRLETVLEPLYGPAMPEPGAVRFRVLLDGEPLLEQVEPGALRAARRQHVLALPPAGRAGARLAFELEGAACYASVLAPVVGPSAIGRYGARPWREDRRDLVLFVADTFRADNLAAYGAGLALCPALDAFAADARVYRQAYSVSTYTLPAHASLLAGLYPHQLGIDGQGRGLPEAARTLAEHLAARGWRCGAVTESVFVSQVYGLDQGFESWLEHRGSLEETLAHAREVLAADDGRPLFLFVHTYRTHAPYSVGDEARARLARLDPQRALSGEWSEAHARLQELLASDARGPRAAEQRLAALERVRSFYLGGAIELDRGFSAFLAELDARGLGAAALAFTSDHGEAFLEHDALYHPGRVWEELVRVPLILRAPGLAHGVERRPASLVDLPATLARLAGVEPEPSWVGSALVPAPPRERALFLFECQPDSEATLGIVSEGRKLIGFEDATAWREGRLLGAFELDDDPAERVDVRHLGAAWPAQLARELGPAATRLLEPLVTPSAAALDPAKQRELRAMGYAGD